MFVSKKYSGIKGLTRTADRKILEAAGAKILGEDDADWGHMLVFEDLDGNVLKLMNPKY